MAIEKRTRQKGTVYRVNWRNPFTGKVEKSRTFETLAEARRFELEVRHRLEFDPESFRPESYIPAGTLPLAELLRLYLEEARMTASTRKMTFYHVRAMLPHLPRLDAKELKRAHLREAEQSMLATGVKQNTVQRRISIVKSAMVWAVDAELLEDNPTQGYRCRRGEDLKLVPPTPSELRAIWSAAPEHLKRAILIGYHLGVRIGPSELMSMTWEDVDLEGGRIRVWSAKKNRRNQLRELDLVEPLAGYLRAWAREDAITGAHPLVHYNGQPVQSIRKSWATALKSAGISRRIRPYDLRHAFATEALAAGADLKSVAEIMGHASTDMIHRHYQHVLDRTKQRTLRALPAFSDAPAPDTSPVLAPEPDQKWKN